jgi:hypothetical protein
VSKRLHIACALVVAALGATDAPAAEGPREACTTVDGAPAATSEPLVVGMRRHLEARDTAGLQKYLDLGQAMLLRGGHEVEVLERRPAEALVKVRRGPRSLPFWTTEQGIACASAAPPPP